jgi:glycosyltransferase involved in cell wall biosynthesis
MASGVPIVVEAKGGWLEMIEHGRTGFLCNSPAEVSRCIADLAVNENQRLDVAAHAYCHLLAHLADPEPILEGWLSIFKELAQ